MKEFLQNIWFWFMDHLDAFVILGLTIALVIVIGILGKERETVILPESYAAWVKQTGNEKGLTFKEWRALNRVVYITSQ